MSAPEPFGFAVVPGSVVHDIIRADLARIVDPVAAACRSHAAGQAVNPASLFLKFPDRRNARIIALPAHLGSPTPISGLKWIASYLDNVRDGRHAPLVLHISLRDLAPEILLAADNIVDDIDHCFTAETSPHLAERLVGHRRFITGTLADVFDGRVMLDRQRTRIFSPFGLRILDLAVSRYVYEKAAISKSAIPDRESFSRPYALVRRPDRHRSNRYSQNRWNWKGQGKNSSPTR